MESRIGRMILVLAVAALCIASCAPAATPTPQVVTETQVVKETEVVVITATPEPQKVLKIGILEPFTGPAAVYGWEHFNAIEIAFDAIDWQIGDYRIEHVKIDSEGNPEKAVRNYEDAIVRQGIDIGFNNVFSSIAVAVMDVAAKYQMPHFFEHGATGIIVDKFKSDPEKYSYWIGKMYARAEGTTFAYIEALEEAIDEGGWDPGPKRCAIAAEDHDWGRTFVETMIKDFEEHGWTVVAEQYFTAEESDFYPMLTRWKDLDVQAIAIYGLPAAEAAFLKQAREIGLNAFAITDAFVSAANWYELAGEASDYAMDRSVSLKDSPKAQAFLAEYKARHDSEPAPIEGGLAYDSANMLIEIMRGTLEEHGELTRESLYQYARDKIEAGEFVFTDNVVMDRYELTLESEPDFVIGPGHWLLPVVQFLGGEMYVVWPPSLEEADIQIPPYLPTR